MRADVALLFVPVISFTICRLLLFQEDDSSSGKISNSVDWTEAAKVFSDDMTLLLQVHASRNSDSSQSAGVLERDLQKEVLQGRPLDGGVVKVWYPYDWLFGSLGTSSCNKPEWDFSDKSHEARFFLPVLELILILLIVSNAKNGEYADADPRGDAQGQGEERQRRESEGFGANERRIENTRRYDLDFARVICVACVVVEHSGGTEWTSHNLVFVLQWVLPFLYITSGVAFMKSRKRVMSFNARLGALLFVGVGANWCADIVSGRDWKGDPGNTVFQMFYVVMLMLMSFLAGPLREALLARTPQGGMKEAPSNIWAGAVYGVILVVSISYFIAGHDFFNVDQLDPHAWASNEASPLLTHGPIALVQVAGILFLGHLACLYKANDLVPWLMLAHIYLPRILIPWSKVGFPHNLELFVFAMTTEAWTLRGYRTFSKFVQSYWPVILFFLMVIEMPNWYGRCDLLPPNTALERVRWYAIECFLCLCLTTQTFQVGDPFNAMGWLNYWALYAYCFHVMWARILPIPYGAVATYSSAMVFYMANRWTGCFDKGDNTCDERNTKGSSGCLKSGLTSDPDAAGG
jgi:hypothetical protein